MLRRFIGAALAAALLLGLQPVLAQQVTISPALPVGSGGTGITTTPAHGILLGEGTGTFGNTGAGTSGQCLLSAGSGADPVWGSCGSGGGGSGISTISPGTGLTGGGSSGTVTLSLISPVVVATGGTGLTTATAHGVLLGEGTSAFGVTSAGTSGQCLVSGGTSADPSWAACAAGTVSSVNASGGSTGLTFSGGPITSGSGTLTLGGGPLVVGFGGTGQSTLTAHGLLIGEGTAVVASLAPGSSGSCLISNGTSSDPAWGSCASGSGSIAGVTAGTGLSGGGTSGTVVLALVTPVAVANGGSGLTTATAHSVLLGEGTSAFGNTGTGTSGTCLLAGGTSADPTWGACNGPYTGSAPTSTTLTTGGVAQNFENASTGSTTEQCQLQNSATASGEGLSAVEDVWVSITGTATEGTPSFDVPPGTEVTFPNTQAAISWIATTAGHKVSGSCFTGTVTSGGGGGGITGVNPGTGITVGGSASDPTVSMVTPVIVAYGGTGVATVTAHGVVIGEGASALSATSAGTSGQCLLSGGSSADPAWGSCVSGSGSITSVGAGTGISVTGTSTAPVVNLVTPVIVANGGTGAATLAAHGVLVGEGTSAFGVTGTGSSGQCFLSNGSSSDPSWGSCGSGGGSTPTLGAGLQYDENGAISLSAGQYGLPGRMMTFLCSVISCTNTAFTVNTSLSGLWIENNGATNVTYTFPAVSNLYMGDDWWFEQESTGTITFSGCTNAGSHYTTIGTGAVVHAHYDGFFVTCTGDLQ